MWKDIRVIPALEKQRQNGQEFRVTLSHCSKLRFSLGYKRPLWYGVGEVGLEMTHRLKANTDLAEDPIASQTQPKL